MKRIILMLIFLNFAYAQEITNQDLPEGFQDINIGISYKEVTDKLENNDSFLYKKEDVIYESRQKNIISTLGKGFIKNAIFQFNEDKLINIILYINDDKIDFYTLKKDFLNKWGNPIQVNPNYNIWEDDTTRIILEKPLTIRYIDLTIFEDDPKEDIIQESKDDFLKSF